MSEAVCHSVTEIRGFQLKTTVFIKDILTQIGTMASKDLHANSDKNQKLMNYWYVNKMWTSTGRNFIVQNRKLQKMLQDKKLPVQSTCFN